jgi:poly-gamma-glutamate capsule biosynthesis protein CapA/YwtB (metallophosphatase superfamily)
MAASGLARPDVGRRLAVAVTAVGIALCSLLLGAPVAAGTTGPTSTATGVGVRSAPETVHQVSLVVRDAEIGAATASGAPQVVQAGAGAATPARPAALLVPSPVFVGLSTDDGGRVHSVDVDGVRGRAPPAVRALAVH